MSLTSLFDSSQRLHRLDDIHDDWEVLTLSINLQAPPDVTDPACPEPLCPPDPAIHTDTDHPGWERLIRSPLATHERASLITTIFSNRDEIEMVKRLCREDAQTFIDVIYEVRSFFHLCGIDLLLTLTRTPATF